MKHQIYERLNEQLYHQVLPNGLTVLVVPRPHFQKKLAYFAVNYGSIHRRFHWQGEVYQVPAGIAHYLEHKMFDLPDQDVSAKLAQLGANVNAFTSYDMTAYHFSCTQNFEECLDLLLEFVSTPYFTTESVEKERGIIDQEIGMNADIPDSRVFEMMMEAMYRHHDIRTPILGTEASIRDITPELLELCHNGFYTPENMVLCVVGDVDPQLVSDAAMKRLGPERRPKAQAIPWAGEEMTCPTAFTEAKMEISMPTFQLGFKCEPIEDGEPGVRQEIIGDLAAEALFGESSQLYLELYNGGLIDSSFGGGFEMADGCAFLTCGGDTHDPLAVRQAILERARALAEEGVKQEDFLRMKRSALGRRIRELDSFDSTCFRMCAYHFSKFDYFCFPGIYESVTVGNLQEYLSRVVQEERCTLSVIWPIEEVQSNE